MCLAVPGKLVELEGALARVDFGGVQRQIYMDLLPDAQLGDWVLAHAGFAIQQLDEQEARETLALLQEWAEFEAENVLGPTPKAEADGGDDADPS